MEFFHNSSILIVDDTPLNLKILGNILRKEGFQVHISDKGKPAIEIAVERQPDLILLDVEMPEMDGFEVCRILKSNVLTASIPVVFVTGKTGTEDILKGFKLGGVDYIAKPYNPAELLARVKTHVELKRSREDIALRKIIERQLREAKEKAEELNRLKSSLLGNMSHEFRTPLIGIIGFSELLQESLNENELQHMASCINKSGKRLLSTLNSILSLSDLEAGKLTPRLESYPINPLLQQVLTLFEWEIKDKKLLLDVCLPEVSPVVITDKLFLEQVLIYLVGNAIKYTQQGSITISVCRCEREDGSKRVNIAVTDTGIGIEEGQKKLIFEEFRQASEGFTRKYEGTGLGLTLAKKMTDLIGGEISVHSILNVGSTFTLNVPAENIPVQESIAAAGI